jgi:hypothetical protein
MNINNLLTQIDTFLRAFFSKSKKRYNKNFGHERRSDKSANLRGNKKKINNNKEKNK